MAFELKPNEKRLLQIMRLTGRAIRINEDGENELWHKHGISDRRFKTLCKNKIFKNDKQNNQTDIVLGPKGEQHIKQNVSDFKYHEATERHDEALFREVDDLKPSELDSAMTANEFRHNINPDAPTQNCPEVIYYSEEYEEWVAVEVITASYSNAMVQSKIEWARQVGVRIKIVDIDGNRGGFY